MASSIRQSELVGPTCCHDWMHYVIPTGLQIEVTGLGHRICLPVAGRDDADRLRLQLFGSQLKRARESKGSTVAALAANAAISPAHLRDIEAGCEEVPLGLALELAGALRTTLWALLS